ncbi:MAG TPA: phosphoribosyltransferase family protein [Bacteroidia bacterium]|nr:phosphoribosyltransferase family protein [Bacteroidia bacterium]
MRFPIADLEGLSAEVRLRYSAMKYGEVQATAWWVSQMAAMIVDDPKMVAFHARFGKICLASSAYGSVPTAATNLAEALASALKTLGWSVDLFQIHRQGGFERTNYGSLAATARKRAMRARKIVLSPATVMQLAGQCVLIVDDLRCTGTHERAIVSLLAQETTVAALVFGYCIGFNVATNASAEEQLNHALVHSAADLLPWFAADPQSPLLNARMLKFILLQAPADLSGFCREIGAVQALRLYRAALSEDGYFDKPRFKPGFAAVEEWLLQAGAIDRKDSYALRNQGEGKVVAWNLHSTPSHPFACAETGANLENEVRLYSRFKFGDVAAIQALGRILAGKMIQTLESWGSLRAMFERAATHGEFVSLTAPGVRNVVSASNALMREVGLRVNLWLTSRGLPTMVIRTLGRLSSGRANYAELSAKQRSGREKTTQTIIPRSEYQAFPSHVVFVDDVEVTGETARRAKDGSLEAGALSFHSVFVFRVDPDLAQANAGIEHRMNHFVVSRQLDATLAEILQHPDYHPVQRRLRLLLHPDNRASLALFLKENVSDPVLMRLYLGAMANDYLWIHGASRGQTGEYAPSLGILRQALQERALLDANGWPL